jgi:hypothetical protein
MSVAKATAPPRHTAPPPGPDLDGGIGLVGGDDLDASAGMAVIGAGLEYGYLGGSFGYPATESLPWVEDGSIWQGADMWAKPTESSDYITGLYRRACHHADGVIATLDLDAPRSVAHWPQDHRATTLGVLLIRMIAATAQHAGHADILRELIDGRGGPDQGTIDDASGREYVSQIEAAASAFTTGADT